MEVNSASHSSSSDHVNESVSEQNEKDTMPPKKQSKAVAMQTILVFIVLLAAGVSVSVVVFRATSKGENLEFQSEFQGKVLKIMSEFDSLIGQKFEAIGALSVTITSFVLGQDDVKFPFVRLNNFQEQAESTRQLSGALYVEFIPIVNIEERATWRGFVEGVHDSKWISYISNYQKSQGYLGNNSVEGIAVPPSITGTTSIEGVSAVKLLEVSNETAFFPVFQSSPVGDVHATRNNLNNSHSVSQAIKTVSLDGKIAIGAANTAPAGGTDAEHDVTRFMAFLLSVRNNEASMYSGEPIGSVYYPVFDSFDNSTKPVGLVFALFSWSTYFEGILPETAPPVTAVLTNACDGAFTFEIRGSEVMYLGEGDRHELEYNAYVQTSLLSDLKNDESKNRVPVHLNECEFEIKIYPTKAFESKFTTNFPVYLTIAVVLIFMFTAVSFFLYHRQVERRNEKIQQVAAKTQAIVSNLFPTGFREDLVNNEESQDHDHGMLQPGLSTKNQKRASASPLAELYPECTILFADVVGFTAWSSEREPSQVFMLLETLYQAFDGIARKRRIFKVETVGDCYVAVAGVPDFRRDHAVAMARFARDILYKTAGLTKRLEITLGPDTADLSMRIGLHSGPVTAGVLRGDRARFQLFGDTVNTTSRIESTGSANSIHVSQETATELDKFGKSRWLRPREGFVDAKGKGVLATYWLCVKEGNSSTGSSNEDTSREGTSSEHQIDLRVTSTAAECKTDRLIEWNVDVWSRLLKQIVGKRGGVSRTTGNRNVFNSNQLTMKKEGNLNTTAVDEVKESISLPLYDNETDNRDWEEVELSSFVLRQLHDFIRTVSALYNENKFHNFEHASHVTMSVSKLLSRIAAPVRPQPLESASSHSVSDEKRMMHDHTYGITSDPLTRFAVVFAALVHDIDHSGVPNSQLVKEDVPIASLYQYKSIAEQNSIDLAWYLLAEDQYSDLRNTIFSTTTEYERFRQLVTNCVMATDIADKELKNLRDRRWSKAFDQQLVGFSNKKESNDRKATIVIEHLIQASDVSHTMQHWMVYRKWNELLFLECYQAFLDGRADVDPSLNWYRGEMAFFDFYIIPLTRKLKDCGVFGVSSDEYLNYAQRNRREWEVRGEDIVKEMLRLANKTLTVNE